MFRPAFKLALGVALALLSLWLAAHRLSFTTDRTQLLDPNNPVQRDWARYRAKFGRTTDYVLLVRGQNVEQARQATDLLGQALKKSPRFQHVFYRLDLPGVLAHGIYFLRLNELREMASWLQGARPWLDLLSAHPRPEVLLRQLGVLLNDQAMQHQLRPILPMLVRTLEGLADSLETGGRSAFQSPLGPFQADVQMLAGRTVRPDQTVFYNQLMDGKTFMLVALPADMSGSFLADIATLSELQRLVSGVRRQVPDVYIMLTGEPAINTEEMITARQDASRCAAAALLFTSLLLVLAFGQITRPLCAVVSLVLGLCWSIGFAALTVGELNLLTVHFVTILTGLGITFSIQMLSEFQKVRAQGKTAEVAVAASLSEARHQAVGAITTAIAFLSLHFTAFRAGAELGWITGMGVLLCYLATLTMLPSLLLLCEAGRACKGHPRYARMLVPLELALRRRPRLVCLVSLAWTLIACGYLGRIPFDYNLLHLQAADAEAIRVEAYLQRIGYSTLYAISMAPDAETARVRAEKLRKLPSVSRVESVLSLEPNQVEEKTAVISQLVKMAPGLSLPQHTPDLGATELMLMYDSYMGMRQRINSAVRSLANEPEGPRLQRVVSRLEKLLNPENPGPISAGLEAYQKALLQDLQSQLATLRKQRAEPPDMLKLVPPEVRLRSISADGTVCLRVFPKEDCWERIPLSHFISDLTKVDKDITGTPVLIYNYLEQLRGAYSISGRNALVVIVVLLLGYYRSLRWAGLALLPKLLGVIWMIGVLGLIQAEFNAANFLALPLTLGIGLIFGMESLRMSRLPYRPLMSRQSAGFAVGLSGLTTLVGFSTLMGAEHRGVASFGLVMSVGVGMNLLTSLVLLPALLAWKGLRTTKP
ncbi:MMPL family transporter [bacterium]|nr:MMPL family transporter [bacterium]